MRFLFDSPYAAFRRVVPPVVPPPETTKPPLRGRFRRGRNTRSSFHVSISSQNLTILPTTHQDAPQSVHQSAL